MSNIEVEQQLLGALLTNNDVMFKVSGVLTSADFYDPVHVRIYEHIEQRTSAGQLASPVTLKAAMVADDGLKELGGPAYLVRLAGAAIGSYAVSDYVQIIVDLSAKRKLSDAMMEARERIRAGEGAADIAMGVETAAGALLSTTSTKPLMVSHLKVITDTVAAVNSAYQGEVVPGVPTGIPQIDAAVGNLRNGQFIVIGGRPSMGKTTLAQNIVMNAARADIGVFFPSLEMNGPELGVRAISMGLRLSGKTIPYNRMVKGHLSEDEMRAFVAEAKRHESYPIYNGERNVREISKLRAAAKRVQQRMADTAIPLSLIVLDYIQLLESVHAKNPRERVLAATDLCKSLAMELDIPVVGLSQLSRQVENREDKRPQLSDLRESGSLEEDADVVMFTYRDAYYLERELPSVRDIGEQNDMQMQLERCRNKMDVIIAKQRGDALRTVTVDVDLSTSTVFPDRSHIEDALI